MNTDQATSISPGQRITAVIREDDQNSLVDFCWGFIPTWATDPSIGKRMFNARGETVFEKPSFRNAFRKRRCLIVADGFYEWQKTGKVKTPFYFRLKTGKPFGFAGLHETWTSPDQQLTYTCRIITTEANDLIMPVHDRMPVIVPKDFEGKWLDPEHLNLKGLLSLLKPYPTEEMEMRDVIV